jgi:MOSC domain-containing protein YiiM
MMLHPPLHVRHLFVSPRHNFFGHHGQTPSTYPMESRTEINLMAGQGLEGDRFFNHKKDYKVQITFFDLAVYDRLCRDFRITDKTPEVFRRNVLTTGVDLNTLIGQTFEIQGIQFEGTEECRPCAWMNGAFCAGAEEALRGWGGLRAKILTSGLLRIDPA